MATSSDYSAPGQLREVLAGELAGSAITQGFLFAVSLSVAIASVMVVFSLVLSPGVTRWTNVVFGRPGRRRHRGVGVLVVVEQHRECPAAVDRLVRVDVAQAGGDTLGFGVVSIRPLRR
jgi:hypothetical protein